MNRLPFPLVRCIAPMRISCADHEPDILFRTFRSQLAQQGVRQNSFFIEPVRPWSLVHCDEQNRLIAAFRSEPFTSLALTLTFIVFLWAVAAGAVPAWRPA